MISSIDYLISAQHAAGGWGYASGQRPVVEATAAALLAIRDDPKAIDSYQRGIAWILRIQHPDGGWGINEADSESGWQTAWALIALRHTTQNSDAIDKAVEWLVSVGNSEISQQEFKKPELPVSDSVTAFIWPWLPEQGGWIEPTASALLALGGIANSQLAEVRMNGALQYFRKYRTPSGGWDHGNAGPLDTIVHPRAYPTALVLFALAENAKQEIQSIDLSALRQDMGGDPSMLAQSSGTLAIRTLGGNDQALITSIMERQGSNGSWDDNPFFTAWASMALRGYL